MTSVGEPRYAVPQVFNLKVSVVLNTKSHVSSGVGAVTSALAAVALLMPTMVKLKAQSIIYALPGSTTMSLPMMSKSGLTKFRI